MNILFLSLCEYESINDRDIYTDLLREFKKDNHKVYLVSPVEKKKNQETKLIDEGTSKILRVKIGNIFNTNVIEKGLSTILIESQMLKAIKRYFSSVKFDLVLYSTPPITFGKVVEFIKQRDNAKTYLLLKDIFPQNAVDLNMLSEKSLIYYYFREKEKKLYLYSDYIGCMSQANVDYVIKHNTEIDASKVEVCPNSITICKKEEIHKIELRKKYDLPVDKLIFIYGGNLGKPQCVDFIIDCLKLNENLEDRYFLICGKGTDFNKLKEYININKPNNIKVINGLPKNEYDELVQACDIGLIFLDKCFTIPNFPSRLLSYMEYSKPVIACTDKNTDIGTVIEEAGMGYWCESNDANKVKSLFDDAVAAGLQIDEMGKNAYQYLLNNYTSEKTHKIIMNHFR